MTRSAEDAALVFNQMLGFDPKDSTSVNRPREDYTRLLEPRFKGLKIGVPKEFFGGPLQPDVEAAVREALGRIRAAGRASGRHFAAERRARHPGVLRRRAGRSVEQPCRASTVCATGIARRNYADLNDMIKKSRSEGFGAEPKRRILVGTYVLSHGYYDAYYIKAQKVRRIIADEFTQAFSRCDVIAGPVTMSVAFGSGRRRPIRWRCTWRISTRCRAAWRASRR